jgi:hypothetical protein
MKTGLDGAATTTTSVAPSKGTGMSSRQKLVIVAVCIIFSPILLGLAILGALIGICVAGAAICLAGGAIAACLFLISWVLLLGFEFVRLILSCCLSLHPRRRAAVPNFHAGPFTRFWSRFFRPTPRPDEPDEGMMVQILEKNRDRRQSRIAREIVKQVYPLGSNPPTPSKAWIRLEGAATRSWPQTCSICDEDLLLYRFPDRDVTRGCRGHPRTVCLECVAKEIQRTLENTLWNEARCLICFNRLSHNEISEFAFREVFVK